MSGADASSQGWPGLLRALLLAWPCLLPVTAFGAEGMASYYGKGFHGRRTASGKRFNQHAMTAAHRTLRFGTRLRVTHLRNQRSVVVTVNDRGPFVTGRVIDLSRAAASRLGMLGSGVARVRIEVLDGPGSADGGPGQSRKEVQGSLLRELF